jgi:hypothetical protein
MLKMISTQSQNAQKILNIGKKIQKYLNPMPKHVLVSI